MTEPLFTVEAAASSAGNGHPVKKRHGVHYTPATLANFVARRAVARLDHQPLVVLDPACGDGELLLATALEAQNEGLAPPALVGVDMDKAAVEAAKERLAEAPAASVAVICADFLTMPLGQIADLPSQFDLVISNPPYVRTQVLGAARARSLAAQFDLRGRVDLYHAFVAAMTARLRSGGVLGLLCSNRFLTTKGGQSLRSLLLRHYELDELWDLGDTKLFEAAVLPAVLVAQRVDDPRAADGLFVRVYEEAGASTQDPRHPSLLSALEEEVAGTVRVLDRRFTIERGRLSEPTAERPWRLTSSSGTRWLHRVSQHSAGRFGDLGPIRVGIKTTADTVFIRSTWNDLPQELRPEDELIHPLITHRVADRWHQAPNTRGLRSVLYPHETTNGRRRPVDLARYPRAAAYLEHHRNRLESRSYIRKARRAWYEIWVPQQPDAWRPPKIVWPDISDCPRFFLDETGAIVNGDCYWLTCSERSEDDIALALAVANSTFALRYYDLCCGNRLYAGRRRFITQYLEDLPMPAISSGGQREITSLVDGLSNWSESDDDEARTAVEYELDLAVLELFGLKEVPW